MCHMQEPSSLDDVPLTMITTVEQLQELNRLLVTVSEFAVDLEVSPSVSRRTKCSDICDWALEKQSC